MPLLFRCYWICMPFHAMPIHIYCPRMSYDGKVLFSQASVCLSVAGTSVTGSSFPGLWFQVLSREGEYPSQACNWGRGEGP